MSSVQFDTHKFVKELMATGFTERQAEVLADGRTGGDLVTKTDLRAELAELENRLTWRMVSCAGLILAAIGALAIFK